MIGENNHLLIIDTEVMRDVIAKKRVRKCQTLFINNNNKKVFVGSHCNIYISKSQKAYLKLDN